MLDKSTSLNQKTKDRIYELINNHHWLEKYNKGEASASYIASLFRYKEDYIVAKILADADISSINSIQKIRFSNALSDENLSPVLKVIDDINSTGQLIFTSKITGDVPKVQYKTSSGQNYNLKVVDFSKLPDDTDLSEFGFEPDTTKKNLRLFIHMTGSRTNYDNIYNSIRAVEKLVDISQGGYLCSSYISLDCKNTYFRQKFGISLEVENFNIANALDKNQNSGYEKSFEGFSNAILQINSEQRNFLPNKIKSELFLSDEEYAQLFAQLASKKYIGQISDNKIYKAGNKKLKGIEIKKAVQNAADTLLNKNTHNEVNIYNPKINALVAKVNCLDDVPKEMLEIAQNKNLPIFLLGE